MLFKKHCGNAATIESGPVLRQADAEIIEIAGQCAKTLAALIKAGSKGITALECGGWAFRLADYVHRLRRDHGLDIETRHEPHEGGRHGRYVLQTPVALVEGA